MKKKILDNRSQRLSVEEYLLLVAKKDQVEIAKHHGDNRVQLGGHQAPGDVEMAEGILPAKNKFREREDNNHHDSQGHPKRARLSKLREPQLEEPLPELDDSRSIEQERAYVRTLNRHQKKLYKQMLDREKDSLKELIAGVSQQYKTG